MSKAPNERVDAQRKEVVARIVADMERDGLEWARPWANRSMPFNPVSGTIYSGRNLVHLWVMGMIHGYSDPRWVTFNQAKNAGWKMHKGSKSSIVEKWKAFKVEDDERDSERGDDTKDDKVVYRCVGHFSVFNAECFDGVPPLDVSFERNEDVEVGGLADEVIGSSRCEVFEEPSDGAFYSPGKDEIHVPEREAFSSNTAFLSTLLHEMGHSTGHPSALGRQVANRFGSEEYAYEELVAELSSVFSAADLGIEVEHDMSSEHYKNHVAYLANWKQALTDDPDVLFRAASAAQKATDYVIERYEETNGKMAPGRERLLAQTTAVEAPERGSLDEKRADIKESREKAQDPSHEHMEHKQEPLERS